MREDIRDNKKYGVVPAEEKAQVQAPALAPTQAMFMPKEEGKELETKEGVAADNLQFVAQQEEQDAKGKKEEDESENEERRPQVKPQIPASETPGSVPTGFKTISKS